MMDWEDSSGSSGSDEDDIFWNLRRNAESSSSNNASRSSMRGMQLALVEGWLIQRARDMCSFAHDRYRQAVQAEANNLSEEARSKMSLKVKISDLRISSYGSMILICYCLRSSS